MTPDEIATLANSLPPMTNKEWWKTLKAAQAKKAAAKN